MKSRSSFEILLTSIAVAALMFCFASDANAQGRGFRIGNFFQAGGGQGFRLGGPRAGMHFGGGQGASIGTQNLGMRFGNGQGARFGGQNYGMQFGGQQGTQIGQFQTTPTVTPGTYYYGDVANPGYAQPIAQPSYAQPYAAQPTIGQPADASQPVMTPSTAIAPALDVASAQSPSIATPGLQVDVPAVKAAKTVVTGSDSGLIRLRYPAEATESMAYTLNGTAFTLAPGETIAMTSGQEWSVDFSAGEKFGERQAVLSKAGEYAFQDSSDKGWVLLEVETPATKKTQVANPNAAPSKTDDGVLDPAPATDDVSVIEILVPEATEERGDLKSDEAPEVPAEPADPKIEGAAKSDSDVPAADGDGN